MPKSQMGIMHTFLAFTGIMVFLTVNATCHLINQKKVANYHMPDIEEKPSIQ